VAGSLQHYKKHNPREGARTAAVTSHCLLTTNTAPV